MKKTLSIFVGTVLLSVCGSALSQSYEGIGYGIFEQSYVKRISLAQAEKVVHAADVFESFLTWEWINKKEKITDANVKRKHDRLIIDFGSGHRLSLRDFSVKESKIGDADAELFKYLKTIPGYYIVGIYYEHDQPQFLLVSKSGNPIYFVDTP